MITLGFDRFERVQTERGADQNSSKDDSDKKVMSHETWFFLSGGVKKTRHWLARAAVVLETFRSLR